GVGDERDDERSPERRLAERPNTDARTGLVERREIVRDLLPRRKLAVRARLGTENRGRSWNRTLGRERGDDERRQKDEVTTTHELVLSWVRRESGLGRSDCHLEVASAKVDL